MTVQSISKPETSPSEETPFTPSDFIGAIKMAISMPEPPTLTSEEAEAKMDLVKNEIAELPNKHGIKGFICIMATHYRDPKDADTTISGINSAMCSFSRNAHLDLSFAKCAEEAIIKDIIPRINRVKSIANTLLGSMGE